MRTSKVEFAPRAESGPIFNFYLGQNTPERKDDIMDNPGRGGGLRLRLEGNYFIRAKVCWRICQSWSPCDFSMADRLISASLAFLVGLAF